VKVHALTLAGEELLFPLPIETGGTKAERARVSHHL
jgi:hypothetical protein